MGGVWCKADKGQRSYSPKAPFNTALSRWTDHVRQAYRKPKHHHRPPRPPQKPARSNERLTISSPTLVTEASSDGWRTATLIVPEAQKAPVPPPRKKRKKTREHLNRSAVSMDDLNLGSSDCLSKSTVSLPDKYSSDTLDSRSSSSTLVVTPVLESRVNHTDNKADEENKENIRNSLENKIEEEEEDGFDITDQPEIIPMEKETLYTSRTLLHSNLGYIDKLSAISEVSAESGFDDKTDILKCSEGSGSVTSVESVPKETSLNILAHIHNINNTNQLKENCVDIKEKTAVSKTEWLQNILKVDHEPYFMSRNTCNEYRRGSDGISKSTMLEAHTGQPNSLPTEHLHLMNREMQTSAPETVANKASPPTPEIHPHPNKDNNHSILLDIIQKHKDTEDESKTLNFIEHKEESIFLTNTKTNIIYKSLSSDKLTDDYDNDYPSQSENSLKSDCVNGGHCSVDATNQINGLTSKTHLSDYSFQTPKLVESDSGLNSLLENKRSNVVSSFDTKEIKTSSNYMIDVHSLQITGKGPFVAEKSTSVNGEEISTTDDHGSRKFTDKSKQTEKATSKEPVTKRDSVSSSRRSSITDSLHEFEMSIYDMLKESKKNENSSDEDESLKTVK